MKKILALLLLLLSLSILSGCGGGEDPDVVYVTVSDGAGDLVAISVAVEYKDADGDGKVTASDALYLLHEAKYPGGAAAGYSAVGSEWGLSLVKLWGVANGGSYGYYVNNASPASLDAEIAPNGHVQAYIYTDTVTFSDTFCFFDRFRLDAEPNEAVNLSLSCLSYDASWNITTLPLAGAQITVNGETIGTLTAEDGSFTLTFSEAGTYTVSAESDAVNLVPPVLTITVD